MNSRRELSQQLKSVVGEFRRKASAEEVQQFENLLHHHHAAALDVVRGVRTARPDAVLAMAKTLLGEADEAVDEVLKERAVVNPDGLIFGFGKYETLDPEWSAALVKYLEYKDNKANPGSDPQMIEIDDRVSFALVGDWGTGYWRGDATPAARVAAQVKSLDADYTIHLGDVYYAGTETEEREFLIDIWPRGRLDQFALNSNHEMYCGGHFYFGNALPQLCPSQRGTSFFALRNADWLIVALDTAYEATDLYLKGALRANTAQTRWLARLKSEIGDRKLIVLSHHEAYPILGDQPSRVYSQVTGALGKVSDFWYWGHLHNVVVYKQTDSGLAGRCIGHGAVPYGNATVLETAGHVTWYETAPAGDVSCPERVRCGFAHVQLDGPKLSERMIGEDGSVRWSG